MVRHAIKIALLMGIAFSGLSCGKNDDFEAELEQCQKQCEERMNSYQCRIGGPNICLCHCELRQGKSLAMMEEDLQSAKNAVSPFGSAFFTGDQTTYSGLRTLARISEANASEIASAVWSSAAKAHEFAIQENGNGGSQHASDRSLDMSLQEIAGGKTYLLEGYRVLPHVSLEYAGINIVSGKLYDPEHGYVDVSTTVPLRIDDSDAWPSSGVLVATGEDDSMLTLSAFSDAVYQMVLEPRQQ